MPEQVTEEGVRPEVATLSEIPKDLSNVTMRFAVDMLKGFQGFDETSITPVELAYATQNFIEVANFIAVREGVPGALIGYVIQETAVQELQLTMVAGVEAQNVPTEGLSTPELIEVGRYSPEELTDEDTLIVDDLSGPPPTTEATAAIDAWATDGGAIVAEEVDDGEEG